MRQETLGIDIGGVISDYRNDGRSAEADPDAYLKSPAVAGACQNIAALVQRFEHRVYLVSKCRWRMQMKTRKWLRMQNIYQQTGIEPDQVWFCLERNEKAEICKVLGVTHFIDDRLEVLGYLTSVPHRVLFRPNPREVERFPQFLSSVTRVQGWNEVPAALPALTV